MVKLGAAVIGATGYAGAEVVRLLARHPDIEVQIATSSRFAGKPLAEACPWLNTNVEVTPFVPKTMTADVIFLCQEAGFAMKCVSELPRGARVVDLSGDFRIKDAKTFEEWYGLPHCAPEALKSAVYGLTELTDSNELRSARLVANPGCYPTAALLALMPLVRQGAIAGVPVIDAKSGVSGAGRSRLQTEFLLAELSGGFRAYSITRHRHTPEIEQMAGRTVRFTPHLIPIARGLHSTTHVPLPSDWSASALNELFHRFYAGKPFIRICSEPPSTKQVLGSNRADLFVDWDGRTQTAVILCVIDNLVKGSAGQAIQNANLMLGLPEEAGLPKDGLWP